MNRPLTEAEAKALLRDLNRAKALLQARLIAEVMGIPKECVRVEEPGKQ